MVPKALTSARAGRRPDQNKSLDSSSINAHTARDISSLCGLLLNALGTSIPTTRIWARPGRALQLATSAVTLPAAGSSSGRGPALQQLSLACGSGDGSGTDGRSGAPGVDVGVWVLGVRLVLMVAG